MIDPQAYSAQQVVDQLDHYGYAVVEGLLDIEKSLDPVVDAMAHHLDDWAHQQVRRGAIGRSFESCSLEERLIELVRRDLPGVAQVLDISLPQGGIRADTPMFLADEVFSLLSQPPLLDVLSTLLGNAIWLSPVGHTRLKVPCGIAPKGHGLLGNVPWHQDNGVLLEEADAIDVVTVWIPLVDVDETNGCLQLLPTKKGDHIRAHCAGDGGLRIPPSELPPSEPMPVRMRRGSVLLMHSRTVHSSVPNLTADRVRLSLDLRYQGVEGPTGRPAFPSFLLRGDGSSPVATPASWRASWLSTRERLADQELGKFNRWDSNAPVCA